MIMCMWINTAYNLLYWKNTNIQLLFLLNLWRGRDRFWRWFLFVRVCVKWTTFCYTSFIILGVDVDMDLFGGREKENCRNNSWCDGTNFGLRNIFKTINCIENRYPFSILSYIFTFNDFVQMYRNKSSFNIGSINQNACIYFLYICSVRVDSKCCVWDNYFFQTYALEIQFASACILKIFNWIWQSFVIITIMNLK